MKKLLLIFGMVLLASCSKDDPAPVVTPNTPVETQLINTVVSKKTEEKAIPGFITTAQVPQTQGWSLRATFKSTYSKNKYGDVVFNITENGIVKNVICIDAFRENWYHSGAMLPNALSALDFVWSTTNINATITINSVTFIPK